MLHQYAETYWMHGFWFCDYSLIEYKYRFKNLHSYKEIIEESKEGERYNSIFKIKSNEEEYKE